MAQALVSSRNRMEFRAGEFKLDGSTGFPEPPAFQTIKAPFWFLLELCLVLRFTQIDWAFVLECRASKSSTRLSYLGFAQPRRKSALPFSLLRCWRNWFRVRSLFSNFDELDSIGSSDSRHAH
jgi:hypothetical protein